MHDGQNLFDKATAGYGKEWEVDEHLDALIRAGKVPRTIVVGIWNTPKRLQEYVPSKAFDGLPPAYRAKVRALYGGRENGLPPDCADATDGTPTSITTHAARAPAKPAPNRRRDPGEPWVRERSVEPVVCGVLADALGGRL